MKKINYPIECKICGNVYNNMLTFSHLKRHGLTTDEYKEKFGNDSISSPEYRKACAMRSKGENNPNYGNKLSEESKKKISEANTGKTSCWKGKSLPEEIKKKMSETKKSKYASGEIIIHNKGKTLSEETKAKISRSVMKYAEENSEVLSERSLKARETLRERYGEDYLIEKQKKMIAAITPEGKQRQQESLRNQQQLKKENARRTLFQKMEKLNYVVLDYNEDEKRITYICDNGRQHTNHRMYFDESRNDLIECKMCIPDNKSKGEMELLQYIETLLGSDKVSAGNKSVIWPNELDVYVPEKNIAFEFNGLYYHSIEMGRDRYYHIDKTKIANEKNIELIHIFEDEWNNKKDIVKSIIRHKLGFINRRIYARRCDIREIETADAIKFINNYHLYGYNKSKVKLGLYHDGELIQVMTFSRGNHSRKQVGWEIDRFATKFDTQVIGGASKLFSFFVNTYSPEEVISYSDLRFGTGSVYGSIGFNLIGTSEPSYFYTLGGVRFHRYSMRKTKEENLSGKTEFELRREQGYLRIYDCGHNKWKWEKKKEP